VFNEKVRVNIGVASAGLVLVALLSLINWHHSIQIQIRTYMIMIVICVVSQK